MADGTAWMNPAPKSAALTPQEIARRSKSSFLASFMFLDRERRDALAAIYAYCRVVDDAADEPGSPAEARAELAFWRQELERVEGGRPETSTGRAVQAAVHRFGTAPQHLRAVLDGVAMDVEPAGFATIEQLDDYCHKVASAVGLACLPVFGAQGAAAEAYARELGLALQLTNILRDLRQDAVLGRCYVPREHLARHGVEPSWLGGDGPDQVYVPGGAVARLVGDLVELARARFVRTLDLLPRAQRRALLPAEVMAATYAELLERVAAQGGGLVRGERVRVPRWRKLWIVLRTWWRGGR